jgi:hypothetical protein
MKHEVIYRNMQYLVGHRIPETNSIDKKWLCMWKFKGHIVQGCTLLMFIRWNQWAEEPNDVDGLHKNTCNLPNNVSRNFFSSYI